jgi:hypothetical protein
MAVGEGWSVGEAFQPGNVVSWGWKMCTEAPVLVVLFGGGAMALSMLPSLLNLPIGISIGVMGETGAIDANVAEALSQVSSLIISLLFMPFQMIFYAGGMVAMGHFMVHGELTPSLLVTSWRNGLYMAVYAILQGFIGMAVLAVAVVPSVGLVFLAAQGTVPIAVAIVVGVLLMVVVLPVSIYVSLGLMVGSYMSAIDRVSPIDAMQLSWASSAGGRTSLFVTGLAFGLLGVLSICMCGLPNVVLIPLQFGGYTAAYLRVTRPEQETDAYAFFAN